jgi:hypothetical protein
MRIVAEVAYSKSNCYQLSSTKRDIIGEDIHVCEIRSAKRMRYCLNNDSLSDPNSGWTFFGGREGSQGGREGLTIVKIFVFYCVKAVF